MDHGPIRVILQLNVHRESKKKRKMRKIETNKKQFTNVSQPRKKESTVSGEIMPYNKPFIDLAFFVFTENLRANFVVATKSFGPIFRRKDLELG